MAERRKRRFRFIGFAAVFALLAAPTVPAVAVQQERAVPVTVPALSNWTPQQGSYDFGPATRLVADSKSEREVAGTLADDLKAAGHGTVPVVRGGAARAGDIVIEVQIGRAHV